MKSLDFVFSSSSPKYSTDENWRQWKQDSCIRRQYSLHKLTYSLHYPSECLPHSTRGAWLSQMHRRYLQDWVPFVVSRPAGAWIQHPPPTKKAFSWISRAGLNRKLNPGFVLVHSCLTQGESTRDVMALPGSHWGIGTVQWGSYWLPFNFCLFNHQEKAHTLLNGTNSPVEQSARQCSAALGALGTHWVQPGEHKMGNHGVKPAAAYLASATGKVLGGQQLEMAPGSQRKTEKCGKRRTEECSDGLQVGEEEGSLLRVKIQRKLWHT